MTSLDISNGVRTALTRLRGAWEWYDAIPEGMRPSKNQPFYHLLAENSEASYVAYVSQQNLVPDDSDEPIDHPAIGSLFDRFDEGRYLLRREHRH